MPVSRSLLFSFSRHRFRQSLCLLQRFGPSKRIQSCSYAKSARNGSERISVQPVTPVEEQASRTSSRRDYLVPATLLGFVGLATFVHYNDERRVVLKGQGNQNESRRVSRPIIGGPFTLMNTERQIITERDLLGNWVLLYFGYTSSPDVGHEQVQVMAKIIDTLGSKHNVEILPVFVTIDPQRDAPAQLRAYLKEFDPRMVGLTGPVSAIRQMAQEYRVYFRKVEEEGDDYLVESSHNMYLMNPKMEVVRCFGTEYAAAELSTEILKELKKAM